MNEFTQCLWGLKLRWQISILISIVVVVCSLLMGDVFMIVKLGPTWRGITVGQSTITDVVAVLGTPSSIEQESRRLVYLYREGQQGKHKIAFHNGVVEYVVEDTLAYSDDTFLAQLIKQHGQPDHVMWSSRSPSDRIAVFSDDGIFVNATFLQPSEAMVEHIFYYQPRSLVRLLLDFKDEMSITNPFPDSDVVGPRDPWFGKR